MEDGRRIAVAAALALATATMASTAFVVAQDSGGAGAEMTAGEEISVLASVQEAQVRHTVQDRVWMQQMEENESTFEDRVETLREQLDRVERRKAEVAERVESGEISERRAAALRAHVEARAAAINRSVRRIRARAQDRGANVTALQELRQRAAEMTGPEVRRVAGNVAAGRGAVGRPGDAGRPEDVGRPKAADARVGGRHAGEGSGDGGRGSPGSRGDGRSTEGNRSGGLGGPPVDTGPAS